MVGGELLFGKVHVKVRSRGSALWASVQLTSCQQEVYKLMVLDGSSRTFR
jgi:hypothetical protein